jgi:2-polyprenyl-3-methyl-5-hydroxy-6-metoxy-1,4-benzoquinol methylase
LQAVLPHIKGRVLDVGCGVGKLCEYISKNAYVGIDVDEESLAIARETYKEHNFKNLSDFKSDASLYDTIVGMAVIEHIKDPKQFLIELKKNLNPAGSIVLTTPHAAFEWTHTLGSKLGLFSSAANEEHEILFTKKTMDETAHAAGLTVVTYGRFVFGVNQLIVLKPMHR